MRNVTLLIYEDDSTWVDSFKFNLEPRVAAEGIKVNILHRLDDSMLMEDLERLPDLILVDHDLGTQTGYDIISQIQGDPQYASASIFYYSGGETLEALREKIKEFQGGIICFTKDGNDLETAVVNKCKKHSG